MKTLNKIWNAFTTILVIAVLLMAVLLVGVRLVGLTPYAVLSGSMKPAYDVGSLIYVKNVDPSEIEVGDPITFVVNEDLLVATHRVIDIDVFYTGTRAVLDENEQPVLDEDGDPVYEEYELEEPSYYFTTRATPTKKQTVRLFTTRTSRVFPCSPFRCWVICPPGSRPVRV